MLTLYRPFNDLFRDEFFGRDRGDFFGSLARSETFTPAVDVLDTEKAYVLKAEVPGLKANDIEVHVENGVLTLKGERKFENDVNEKGYRRVERRYGSFSRAFTLPKGVDPDAIEADASEGVLTITIPKAASLTPRKVEVKVGGRKAEKMFQSGEQDPAKA